MKIFSSIYEKYSTDVFHFAYHLSGNRADAEDITSEVFLRAFVGKDKIRMESVKGYLLAITRNLYLKQQRNTDRIQDLDADLSGTTTSLEDTIEIRSQYILVMKIIHSLPEPERTALILRVEHELPYSEIARILNISLSNAKVKVHRVRLKIAQIYESLEEV